ncbi:MAG: enoyl-CoA hydratase/isomerase family protein [Candidatus Brocadiae bacterium]|nr:enoyl-CoA hydratase/isomerase family protein [Candidatus Brocadiia bacterium]
MKEYKTLVVSVSKGILSVVLNRPEIHNAFDENVIQELNEAFVAAKEDKSIRCLVLSGQGASFCAGADMNWMRKMKNYSYEKNYEDAYLLSEMLYRLYALPFPTIAKINGSAFGGGVGLVSACDISIAASCASFSLSEVKLGLVPACISPYLLGRIQPGVLRRFFLTGERFDAGKAKEIGLINEIVPKEELDQKVAEFTEKILSCGPNSLAMAKEILEKVPGMRPEEYMRTTAEWIAKLRIGQEAQEGLSAFLEKRKPQWAKQDK